MKKTIIAMAIAAVSAAPMVANAGVTTYAQAYAGLNMNSSDDAGKSNTSQDDNTGRGRLGFKASEELGGGMTSFAKFEMQLDINDAGAASGADILTQRTAVVGLKAGWGAISAGRMAGAYKMAGGVTFDPFVTTGMDARGFGMAKGSYAQNGFLSQMIQYKSPKFSGVQVVYQLSMMDDDTAGSDAGTEGDSLYSITYTGVKGLKVIYASATDATDGAADKTNTKFGFKYKINKAMSVAFQSEDAEATKDIVKGVESSAGDYTYMAFSYKMGKHNITVANGTGDLTSGEETTYFAIGDTMKLSKQTSITFGQATRNSGKAGVADVDTLHIGLRKNF